MNPHEQAELRWALRWADGDMGVRSTFSATLACLELGVSHLEGGVMSTDLSERAVLAAGRERRVRRALGALPRRFRLVLELAHGPHWTGPTLAEFGRATPVALLAPAATAAWQQSGHRGSLPEFLTWLSWAAGTDEELAELADSIRSQAQDLLREAEQAYEFAVDSGPLSYVGAR